MTCKRGKYLGEGVIASLALDWDGVADPEGLTYIPYGSVTGKSFSLTGTTLDGRTDETGFAPDNVTIGAEGEATLSAYATDADTLVSNQHLIHSTIATAFAAQSCVRAWVRMMLPPPPGGTHTPGAVYIYCNLNGFSLDASGLREFVTSEITATMNDTYNETYPALIYVSPEEIVIP